MQYTNRAEKKYYLREGKTKTGKPRYCFSTKKDAKGKAVKQIPEGYEIYEHPENAQVFLRKKRPGQITDIEKYLIEKLVGKLNPSKRYVVDCRDAYITIYESNTDFRELESMVGELSRRIPLRPGMNVDNAMKAVSTLSNRQYTAMMRFCLVDKKRREFMAERFCFRGSVDDWIHSGGPGKLKNLAEKFIKHLGADSFYDLPF